MIPVPNPNTIQALLKGGVAGVLACWVLVQQMTIREQGENIELMRQEVSTLNTRVYELQNTTIKENTKALAEFNLIANKQLPYNP